MTSVATVTEPQQPTRVESPQLQQARAKLAQLETLLKQGRTILQDLRTQVDDVKKERDELRVKLDEMSLLMGELRVDRDRAADELTSSESRHAALEEKLGAANGAVDQLRADAEHALALAREIIDIYAPDQQH